MASMTTPVAARMASLANTASPESICVTGDHARMEQSARTEMASTFVIVLRALLVRTVTRPWIGAPATLVRMELCVPNMELHSLAHVPVAGLARSVT